MASLVFAVSVGSAYAQEVAQTDIRNVILSNRSADCSDYVGTFFADVEDIQMQEIHRSRVVIEADETSCSISSNGTPNHDFNGTTARFANDFQPVEGRFVIARNPAKANEPTELSQTTYDAILLNGAPVDLLSAGCYRPEGPRADKNGNVLAGCTTDDAWLIDPPAYDEFFGVDLHNAHTQPDGRYHYHANPNALFEDRQLAKPSPVIGFAADGFPIFGTNFLDENGVIRAAISSYELKSDPRPSPPEGPGGQPDGTYIEDYEFTGGGDLDTCNGMTVDGQYGYYVTTSYPWILKCLIGAPDPSFRKSRR